MFISSKRLRMLTKITQHIVLMACRVFVDAPLKQHVVACASSSLPNIVEVAVFILYSFLSFQNLDSKTQR